MSREEHEGQTAQPSFPRPAPDSSDPRSEFVRINEFFQQYEPENREEEEDGYDGDPKSCSSEGGARRLNWTPRTELPLVLPYSTEARSPIVTGHVQLADDRLIAPPAGCRTCHAATCVTLPWSGVQIVAFFAGHEREGGSGVGIAVCRRHRQPYGEDCGDFSDAAMVASEQGYSMQNPVLFLMEPPVEQGEKDDERPKGRRAVGLIHTKQESYKGQATSVLQLRYSFDDGLSWTLDTTDVFSQIGLGFGTGAFSRCPPVWNQVSDQTWEWVLPLYFTPKGFYEHAHQYSALLTMIWDKSSSSCCSFADNLRASSQLFELAFTRGKLVQPCLVPQTSTELLVFYRSRDFDNVHCGRCIRTTLGGDGHGCKWEVAAPPKAIAQLENPNSSVGQLISAISLGSYYLVACNPSQRHRFPLSLAVLRESGDGGFHCVGAIELVGTSSGGSYGEYSYPTVSLSPGAQRPFHVDIVYTFQRRSIRVISIGVQHLEQALKLGF